MAPSDRGISKVYVAEIDDEHRELIDLGREIQQAAGAGASASRLRTLVESLMETAEEHFTHEEKLMRAARYSGYQWHKGQHDGVRRRMKEYLDRLDEGDREAPALLAQYLFDWIRDHSALSDRMMGAAIRNYSRRNKVS